MAWTMRGGRPSVALRVALPVFPDEAPFHPAGRLASSPRGPCCGLTATVGLPLDRPVLSESPLLEPPTSTRPDETVGPALQPPRPSPARACSRAENALQRQPFFQRQPSLAMTRRFVLPWPKPGRSRLRSELLAAPLRTPARHSSPATPLGARPTLQKPAPFYGAESCSDGIAQAKLASAFGSPLPS